MRQRLIQTVMAAEPQFTITRAAHIVDAILAELRTPDEAMLAAGFHPFEFQTEAECFTAMIEAIK